MSSPFEPRAIAAHFAITLSPRYLRFLADERTTLGRRFAVVPSYQSALPVAFDGGALESFFHDDWPEEDPGYAHPYASEVTLAGTGWVPLATLGEEAQFLVVKATDETCEVAMWEHETRDFTPCAPSLDAFLASLGTTKATAKDPARAEAPKAPKPKAPKAPKPKAKAPKAKAPKAKAPKAKAPTAVGKAGKRKPLAKARRR